jgi:trk system potassium uptake protein
VARALWEAGHAVNVVDLDEETFDRLGEDWDGECHVGHGMEIAVLEAAGIERASRVVAATDDDCMNLVVVQVAQKRYGIENVAARVLDEGRAVFYANRGIEIVSPTAAAIDQLTRWGLATKKGE